MHSPLVGPATWRWVAEALVSARQEVIVPDLRDAAVTGDPEAVIATAVAALPSRWEAPVVVGHSGAGSILPSVAAQLRASSPKLVFVDAGLPPCQGAATPGAPFLDYLRTLVSDGLLPRWSASWGDGVMETLVPDVDRRSALEAEIPEIPLAYFESPLDVPDGWCQIPGSFVLLSEPYRSDAERSRALGWPTVERLGGHLDIVNDPAGIARTIIELAGRP